MAVWHGKARAFGPIPPFSLRNLWTGGLALVMFCAPILLSAHGAWSEDTCSGPSADYALVDICPICEICDSIPSAMDISDPVPARMETVAQRVIFVSHSVPLKSLVAESAAPRAPPYTV